VPRVLFILGHWRNVRFFDALASLLEARGVEAHFLATERSLERRADAVGRRAPNVMHTRIPERTPSAESQDVSLEDVCRYFLAMSDAEGCAQRIIDQADAVVRAYGVHFDRVRPDLVVCWNGTIPRLRAGMKLAEARSIRTSYFEQGNFPGTLICDERGVNYDGSIPGAEVPREFNRERIESWLETYHMRPRVPQKRWRQPMSLFFDAAVNFCARRSMLHPTLYFDEDKAVGAGRLFRRLFRRMGFGGGSRIDADDELRELPERFVFLPLQVHDDTQVVVHSPRVRTMTQLVSQTLSALPEGLALVVKSHPADEGRRSYREIERMLAGGPHRFVRRAGTLELARRSTCVMTINSTVGLEALTHMKPVVVLGEAVYGGRGMTHDVTDLAEFAEVLARAVDAPPERDDVLRFLDYYIFEYCVPGNHRDVDPDALSSVVDRMLTTLGGADNDG
jgi:capsular polysaccharide export protein